MDCSCGSSTGTVLGLEGYHFHHFHHYHYQHYYLDSLVKSPLVIQSPLAWVPKHAVSLSNLLEPVIIIIIIIILSAKTQLNKS